MNLVAHSLNPEANTTSKMSRNLSLSRCSAQNGNLLGLSGRMYHFSRSFPLERASRCADEEGGAREGGYGLEAEPPNDVGRTRLMQVGHF